MHCAIAFDPELLRRYDRPGPRYTSYPTAPQFVPEFGERQYKEQALLGNSSPVPRPLSLYLHVPYCFSPCFYCGCNRIITRDPQRGALYAKRLIREIGQTAALFARDREVVQVHFGGGTPNFLSPSEIGGLMESLRRNFRLSSRADRDFSIELDPRCVQPGDIAAYAAMGLIRASLGVQDFDAAVQRAVNREQSVEQTLEVVAACRASGFRSVNIDLIYGLPKQTEVGFARTLETVLSARPERLSVYGYAHMPQVFKAQRQINHADLPDAPAKLALLQLAVQRLTQAGYQYIGMDHFALPNDDLARAQRSDGLQRNFMGYTTHAACDLIGLGVSAISHLGDSFSQNARDLPAWEIAVDGGRLPVWRGMVMDFDDRLRSEIIQQLMCRSEVDIAAIERRYEISFNKYFAGELAELGALALDGLVDIGERRIAATAQGRLLLRVIAMCFDRYLKKPKPAGVHAQYSRAI
jgi:oxygen-independent coproporphyrinogen III oxidase